MLDNVSAERARQAGLISPRGALVCEVGISDERGVSPASRAGLKAGDIILRWGAKAIDRRETLVRAVGQTETGSSVQVVVLRDRERLSFPVTVGKRPPAYN
jgi:serine protease Do